MNTPDEDISQPDAQPSVDETEQLIVFTVDREEYAVPISDVREVLDIPSITPVPDSPPFVLGIMNLRGKVVPILDLEKRLQLQREHNDTNHHVLVTDYEHTLIGVQVDQVKEVLKVSRKQIKPTPSMITSKISPEFLRGVIVITKHHAETDVDETAQSDARVLLLLELRKIITPEEASKLHPQLLKINEGRSDNTSASPKGEETLLKP